MLRTQTGGEKTHDDKARRDNQGGYDLKKVMKSKSIIELELVEM